MKLRIQESSFAAVVGGQYAREFRIVWVQMKGDLDPLGRAHA